MIGLGLHLGEVTAILRMTGCVLQTVCVILDNLSTSEALVVVCALLSAVLIMYVYMLVVVVVVEYLYSASRSASNALYVMPYMYICVFTHVHVFCSTRSFHQTVIQAVTG